MFRLILIVFSLMILMLASCSRDELPEVNLDCDETISYANGVREIINVNCAYSGCHDGSAGIGPGDYTRYNQALLRELNTGSFRSRVIDQRENASIGMPPNKSVYPESQKDDLTEDELAIILCWLDDGFPER
jgi:hypothetical protein